MFPIKRLLYPPSQRREKFHLKVTIFIPLFLFHLCSLRTCEPFELNCAFIFFFPLHKTGLTCPVWPINKAFASHPLDLYPCASFSPLHRRIPLHELDTLYRDIVCRFRCITNNVPSGKPRAIFCLLFVGVTFWMRE